jgi:putative transcriptional regulator
MAVRYPTGVRNFEGKLLVAHPMLNDFFHRAVIFVYQDDPKNGTAGLVLNKPTRITVNEITSERGLAYGGTEHVYKGGPVNDTAVIMLHEDQWYGSNTMQIGNSGLAITSDNVMMEKLSMGNAPLAWRMCMGIAGWSPGQLSQELNSRYGWLTCDANPSIVFAKDGERQWQKALQLCANQTIDQYL